jgi:hypothetical protein
LATGNDAVLTATGGGGETATSSGALNCVADPAIEIAGATSPDAPKSNPRIAPAKLSATYNRPAGSIAFHLKLVAAAAAGLGDPVRIVDAQRHALLAGLGAAQRTALAEPDGSVAGLLLEGVVLRLQADLRWLEACAAYWTSIKRR